MGGDANMLLCRVVMGIKLWDNFSVGNILLPIIVVITLRNGEVNYDGRRQNPEEWLLPEPEALEDGRWPEAIQAP